LCLEGRKTLERIYKTWTLRESLRLVCRAYRRADGFEVCQCQDRPFVMIIHPGLCGQARSAACGMLRGSEPTSAEGIPESGLPNLQPSEPDKGMGNAEA
jgi:hypothetical protein